MTSILEKKLPKSYIFTVEGFFDEGGEELKKFSVASHNRNIENEFDLDLISSNAALQFFLDNEYFKEKESLVFNFYSLDKTLQASALMTLCYTPSFLSQKIDKENSPPVRKTTRRKK